MDSGFADLIGRRTFESGAEIGSSAIDPDILVDSLGDEQEDCVCMQCTFGVF